MEDRPIKPMVSEVLDTPGIWEKSIDNLVTAPLRDFF